MREWQEVSRSRLDVRGKVSRFKRALAAPLGICTLFGLATGLLGGCGPLEARVAGEPCVRTLECAQGLACVAGACSADVTDILGGGPPTGDAAIDLAMMDAGDDAGVPDLGMDAPPPVDTGMPDMGVPDMAMPDMGAPDMGMPDMGAPDMGMPDMGMPDMGAPDMGMPDMGMPDMGAPDMGMPDSGVDMGAPDMMM